MTDGTELRAMVIALARDIARRENWTRTERRKAEVTLARQPAFTLAAEFAYLADRWRERRNLSHLSDDERFAAMEARLAVRQSARMAAAALAGRRTPVHRVPHASPTRQEKA